MASLLKKLFRRKKQPPLVCAVTLDDDGNPIADNPDHMHTASCFISFEPLAVVELFQSQGCQSCPPALPDIQDATNHPNILLLTYNVTLFNHLGWKDTFATPAWDQRQRAYAKRWNRNSLFTPQLVVNGVADGSGSGGKTGIQEIISSARSVQQAMDWHIYLDSNDSEVRIDSDKYEVAPHDILVVIYKATDEVVKVGSGPNKRKKMNHRNVVVDVVKIGEWTGGNISVALPMSRSAMDPAQDAAVLVQQGGGGGAIIAVAKI
ncbi:thioredoxin-like protein [Mariannaea sp. PMI_226]|nr:thioredoxin-like protein [Mariannaea sp. PMI_226]